MQLGLFPVSEEAIWQYCRHMHSTGANRQPLEAYSTKPPLGADFESKKGTHSAVWTETAEVILRGWAMPVILVD